MINLLPPEAKQQISYGRRNTHLTRWLFAMVIVIVGIGIMTIAGQLYINQNVKNLQKISVQANERMASQNLEQTKKELSTLSGNLKTVLQILSKQLLFSSMFKKIGGVMPSGSALNGITLSSTDSAIDLAVGGVDKNAATQAFINISDPKNGFFEKADLISVTCSQQSSGTETVKYPCTANVRVTLKNDSSFFFLNTVSGAKTP